MGLSAEGSILGGGGGGGLIVGEIGYFIVARFCRKNFLLWEAGDSAFAIW